MNNMETKSYSFREGSSLAYSTLDAYHSFYDDKTTNKLLALINMEDKLL